MFLSNLQGDALLENRHVVEARFFAGDKLAAGDGEHEVQKLVGELVEVLDSSSWPQLKSIHFDLCLASKELLEIFIVGTGEANGVPRPVVKSTMCAPLAASAVLATKSLPGAESRFNPLCCTLSP